MGPPPEERTLAAALARGLVAPAQVEGARRAAQARPGSSILGSLAGSLDAPARAELVRLHQELQASGSGAQADATATRLTPGPGPDSGRLMPSLVTQLGPPPAAGTLGPYTLVRELARGGMGAVWIARRPGLDREVALKLLLSEGDPAQVERFKSEARIAARLRHPNVVAIHDVGEERGRHWLVMDLIQGQSLQARLEKEGPLEPRRAGELGAKLARALAYAHAQAVLHRDLKPHNVLIDERGEPLLTDFGLAKDTGEERGLTRTGQVMGTPAYMAPEQAEGQPDLIDRRTDVYSLGATLYAALVGRPPFEGSSGMALIAKVLTAAPPAPRSLRREIDRDLETIVLRCLEKEPEARYASAQALAEDLERWLRDEPIEARRPGPVERAARWARRNRSAARGLAAAVLVSAVGLGAAGFVAVRARLAEETAERRHRDALAGQAAAEQAAALRRAAELRAPLSSLDPALDARPLGERAERLEPVLGELLRAHSAAQRWHALAPQDPQAQSARAETALLLSACAREAEQWSLADRALVDLGGVEVEAARKDVARARKHESSERRRRVMAALEALSAPGQIAETDSIFRLIQERHSETTTLLLERVERVSEVLREANRAHFLGAVPTPAELERGYEAVPSLADALAAWLDRDQIDEPGLAVLDRALGNLRRRANEGGGSSGEVARARALRGALEAAQDPWGQRVAVACAVALSVAGERELAELPLARLTSRLGEPALASRAANALNRLDATERVSPHLRVALLFQQDLKDTWGSLPRLARLVPAPAQGATGPALEGPEAQAARLLTRGELQAALAALLPREREPTALSLVLAARAWRLQGEALRAHELAVQAVKRAPLDADAWVELSEALLATGQLTHAGQRIEEALRIQPDCPRALVARAFLRRRQGDLPGALADLARALELEPGLTEVRLRRGAILAQAGRPAEAEADLTAAIEQAPALALARVERARARWLSGRREEAHADLEAALTLGPGLRVAHHVRGGFLLQDGRLPEALQELDLVLARDPPLIGALIQRAEVHAGLGNTAQALADADRAVQLEPRSAQHRLVRAKLRANSGDVVGARQDAEEAARLAPGNADVERLRAELR